MYQGYGYPPPFGYPVFGPMGEDNKTVELAKQIIKQHKAEKKRKAEEEKKKEAKSKPRLFTFFELWGAILFFSIPITLCQLWLIQQVNHAMNNAFPH